MLQTELQARKPLSQEGIHWTQHNPLSQQDITSTADVNTMEACSATIAGAVAHVVAHAAIAGAIAQDFLLM